MVVDFAAGEVDYHRRRRVRGVNYHHSAIPGTAAVDRPRISPSGVCAVQPLPALGKTSPTAKFFPATASG
jgi:hypothetical protein